MGQENKNVDESSMNKQSAQETSSVEVQAKAEAYEESNEQEVAEKSNSQGKKKGGFGSLLCFIVLVAVAGTAGYSLYLSQKCVTDLNARPIVPDYGKDVAHLQAVAAEQASTKQKFEDMERRLSAQGGEALSRIDNLTRAYETMSANYAEISRKVNGKASEIAVWQVAEARFLTRMADRKMRIDRDYSMAADLLQEADKLILSLDDNRAYNLRSIYAKEITRLRSIPSFDYEGVALRLSAMADKTDELKLQLQPGALLEGGNKEVTSDIKDWKENLYTSLNDFTSKFIVVRSKNETEEMLVHPENQMYVRENLRILLTAASLAGYRGDYKYFCKNRDEALQLLTKYFDEKEHQTRAMISMLKEIDIPVTNTEGNNTSYLESVHVIDEFINDINNAGGAK